jgi:hypothetical protein
LKILNLSSGGFCGKKCEIQKEVENSFETHSFFYPDDSNKFQEFPLEKFENVKKLKIIFHDSTDFFGRITIYKIDFLM